MKKILAAALAVILAAGTITIAAPAQAASGFYRQASRKYELWDETSGTWSIQNEEKYTFNSKGNTLTYYSRYKSFDPQTQKNKWLTGIAQKYVYNSDGSVKQRTLYSDIRFKKYLGKAVYSYSGKGSARRLSKVTNYDLNNKKTDTTSYSYNSRGQETKAVTVNKKNEKVYEYTVVYNGDGTRKSNRTEEYLDGRMVYWYSTSYTYKNHILSKEVIRNSSGTTYTTTYKNGLKAKRVVTTTSSKTTTVYSYNSKNQLVKETDTIVDSNHSASKQVRSYSGYDKNNNYTKSRLQYISDSYSTATDYQYVYKYSGDRVLKQTVSRKTQNSDHYVNYSRTTNTYKKFTQ